MIEERRRQITNKPCKNREWYIMLKDRGSG
jgi:hypothetical protein